MKLFLTSTIFQNDKITKEVFRHINKSIKECKVLFIPNEKATIDKLQSRKYIDRVIECGFCEKNIYIFNKYKPENFINLNIDIVTIGGGNTFATLNDIRKCNFDKEIVKYIRNGVIYIGGSCGSHIVTSNIKHVERYDENVCNLKEYNALNLFKGILICHFAETRKKDYEELINDGKYKVYPITNDEFLICDENSVEKISV